MNNVPDLRLDLGMPGAPDAERTCLGAVMLDNQAWQEIRESLRSEDFSLDSHRLIAKYMKHLADNGRAIDIVTLADAMNVRRGTSKFTDVESIGGVSYLATLTEGLPRRPVISEYIRIIKDKSVLRKLMGNCSQAISRAAEQAETGLEITASLMSQLEALSVGTTQRKGVQVSDFILESMERANERYRTKVAPRIPTGNAWLDAKMGGILHGYYTIVAARPKIGKSAFGDSAIAYNCKRGLKVVKISLEVDRDMCLYNLVPYVVDLPNLVCVKQECQTPEQHTLFNEGMSKILEGWNLKIYEGDIDCDEVCWIIDRETKDGEEVLFVLDHFGLMVEAGKNNLSKIRESYVLDSGRLRRKIYKKRAAVMALFQLNEVAREYADKLPRPADIGESKKPLQDCAAMVLLHRYMDKETLRMTKKANINLALIRGGGSSGNIDGEFDTKRLEFVAQPEIEYGAYYEGQ